MIEEQTVKQVATAIYEADEHPPGPPLSPLFHGTGPMHERQQARYMTMARAAISAMPDRAGRLRTAPIPIRSPRPSDAVEVCDICDIAGCHHIRERDEKSQPRMEAGLSCQAKPKGPA